LITYDAYAEHVLREHLSARCGDTIELRLFSLQLAESNEQTVERLLSQFTGNIGLVPHQVAVAPDHFAKLSRRVIDVLLDGGNPWRGQVDGATIPTSIPYVEDSTLPPGCVSARFMVDLCHACQFARDLAGEMGKHNWQVVKHSDAGVQLACVDRDCEAPREE